MNFNLFLFCYNIFKGKYRCTESIKFFQKRGISMLIIWGIAVFMGILTVVLLMGKGSFLIAGYNTSSKEEKQEYDEKKLCRVVGGGMGVITLMLIGWGFVGEKFPVSVFLIVTIVTVIIIQILSNTICRAQANDGSVQKKKTARDKIYIYGSFLFTAVILAGVTFMLFTGHVTPVMHEDSIEIQVSYWADKEVPYSSIRSVKLAEDLQRGSRKNGVGGPTLQAGHYKNGEFGDYMLYSYTSCDTFVVLDTEQGIVVLNGKDDAATRKLYSDIQTAVDRGFSLPIQ